MSQPTMQVLVDFTLQNLDFQPYFELDNAVKGVLDNSQYRLAWSDFVDVSNLVRRINLGRGKDARFDEFQSGAATIDFNNHERFFDPLYEQSPFAGSIVPRRKIVVIANDIVVFTGFIEDWDLSYMPDGDSIAQAKAYDGFYILAGQQLEAFTPVQQKTGDRIDTILSRPEVDWPTEDRLLDTGLNDVGTQSVSDNLNVLNYLQQVSQAEPGLLFLSADGKIVYKDKYKQSQPNPPTFGPNDIHFSGLEVIYGSELLYNKITIANEGGGTAVSQDLNSQQAYGIRSLALTDLIGANDDQSVELALYYSNKYSEPRYRFQSVEIALHSLDEDDKNKLLALELGDVAIIQFTPNNIPPTIERTAEIIGINHSVSIDQYFIEFSLQQISIEYLRLDDPAFGRIDSGILA